MAVKPTIPVKDDIVTERPRWRSRTFFVVTTIGYAIGIGNVWKFPYLTFKHGGPTFILTYIFALVVVGIPMMILEMTLGQKMQRGSAGSMRGIVPRLAGFGWVASFCGFLTSLTYNVLLGMCVVYFFGAWSQPWSGANYKRTVSCQTGEMMASPTEELYLYQNVTKLYGTDSCQPFQDGDLSQFAAPLFLGNLLCWALIASSLAFGPKLIEMKAIVSVPLRFVLIIVFIIKFASLNSSVSGDGISYYMGSKNFPLPPDGSGKTKYLQFANVAETLFSDAYAQVFFSLGVCYGGVFAYSSYNKTKKPVIQDALIVCIVDFLFAFISGFGVWGGIGYLQKKGNIAYNSTSSVGLIFVAMPAAAAESDSAFFFGLLCFTLLISGIDSAVGFVEAWVTNIIDATGWDRKKVAIGVVLDGIVLSALFTSNWGWVLFDMVDHYMNTYIVFSVGLMQCIAVGWVFERESTSARSLEHKKSMRALAVLYWFPAIFFTLYGSMVGIPKFISIIILIVTTAIAFLVSYFMSKLTYIEWYHEIVMCGTDKISMSITILSNPDGKRKWWMIPFEAYFGLLIKFVNPICLLFFIFEGLQADLE